MNPFRKFELFLIRIEGLLKWLFAVFIALLVVSGLSILLVHQVRSFEGPKADLIFAFGVIFATTAAATDFWSRIYQTRPPTQSRSLGIAATALTWIGIGVSCYAASVAGFDPLPLGLAAKFFGGMTVLSLAGGWLFALISSVAPPGPGSLPTAGDADLVCTSK